MSYSCFDCKKVFGLSKDQDHSKCPSCGNTNGETVSIEQIKEGMEAGTYFNIGTNGKRLKPKRK